MDGSRLKTTVVVVAAFLLGVLAAGGGDVRAAWDPIARLLRLQSAPVPVSANVLSEHEIEVLDDMAPEAQAHLLLERSINHYRGANEQIAARVESWRGQIAPSERFESLFRMAINSDDLMVRIAGIEIDIVARGLTKEASTVDRLEQAARYGDQGPRVNAMWDLALVANRGVEQARVEDILMPGLDDRNENIRYWAVEGLSYVATDSAIDPLLRVLHDDVSPAIRERAACGLAQSGMFTAAQRMKAVPRLLDYADDFGLDEQTRQWVFQALRDITGQTLPRDANAWRAWYASRT